MAEEIRAEIVGYVVEVVVETGQLIEEGDPVIVLESMKMEIPALAESTGIVTALGVSVGDVVQEGDLIAVIE